MTSFVKGAVAALLLLTGAMFVMNEASVSTNLEREPGGGVHLGANT